MNLKLYFFPLGLVFREPASCSRGRRWTGCGHHRRRYHRCCETKVSPCLEIMKRVRLYKVKICILVWTFKLENAKDFKRCLNSSTMY